MRHVWHYCHPILPWINKVVPHPICDRCTFPPDIWYSDPGSSLYMDCFLFLPGMDSLLIAQLAFLACRRDKAGKVCPSFWKSAPPFWGYSFSFMLRRQNRLYTQTQMKVAMWRIPSQRVVGKSLFNSVWSRGITLKELCQLSFSST